MHSKNTNWHVAMTSAMKIDLRDYADILEFDTEAFIWDKKFRLDMIIIKKLSDKKADNFLVREFRAINIFEIKGIGSSIDVSAFYKSLAYAGLYASERARTSPLPANEVTINLMSRHYPRKLAAFLRHKCGFDIEKSNPGVYHVEGTAFPVRIIVTSRLPKEDFLYLFCATDDLKDSDAELLNLLGQDISDHRQLDLKAYADFIQQLYNAYSKKKGTIAMAIKKKVKSIQEMNLSEMARYIEKRDMLFSELNQEKEQQKSDYIKLSLENEKQKSENANLAAELQDCKELISRLQEELLALKNGKD